MERDWRTVAREHVTLGIEPLGHDLQPLDRGIDIPRSSGATDLFSEDVPWFDRSTELEANVVDIDFADQWESEFEKGFEPRDVEIDSVVAQIGDHVVDVGTHVPREQVAIVEFGPPSHERAAVRSVPETGDQRPHEQGLDERHLRMWRHLEGPQLEDPQAATFGVGAEEFVDAELGSVCVAGEIDEQMSKQSVDDPWWSFVAESVEFGECDLQFVERVSSALVDTAELGWSGR